MLHLIAVSLLWAASPGLIKTYLSGANALPADAVGTLRFAFALLVFLPFLRVRGLNFKITATLVAIGAIQFGLMYQLYLRAFAHLKAYEIGLFTILTPLYVICCEGLFSRRFQPLHLLAALLAVAGGALLSWNNTHTPSFATGFWLLQGSGICFAFGQIAYRHCRASFSAQPNAAPEHHHFALLYLGAIFLTAATSARTVDWASFTPNSTQWIVLAILGILSSGVGFFAWNIGATRVSPGTLAAFNNLKIPLMVGASILIFRESADPAKLLASSIILILAIWIGQRNAEGQLPRPVAKQS